MNRKQTDILLKVLFGISTLIVIVGTLLKIMHKSHGNQVFGIGFLLFIFFLALDNYRLNKKIKELEKDNN